MDRKIDKLIALMKAGEWHAAIKFAAKFPRLENERDAILSASSALLSPSLYRGMGKDVDAIVAHGIDALQRRYASYL
jgi:hypothetical protein